MAECADSLARSSEPSQLLDAVGSRRGLDDESYTASALFYLDGQELRGIRMRLEGQVLINELADYQPCTIAQWARLSALVDPSQLAVLVQHLAGIGLVAYA